VVVDPAQRTIVIRTIVRGFVGFSNGSINAAD